MIGTCKIVKSSCAEICDGNLWLVHDETKTLCKFSIEDYSLIEFFDIPEMAKGDELFSRIIIDGEYVFLIPYNAEAMWRFDCGSGMWTEVDLGLNESEKKIKNKAYATLFYHKKVYIFGWKLRGIFVYDCVEESSLVIKDFLKRLNSLDENAILFHKAICCEGGYIYSPVYLSKYMLKLNIYTNETELLSVPSIIDKDFTLMEIIGEKTIMYDEQGIRYVFDDGFANVKKNRFDFDNEGHLLGPQHVKKISNSLCILPLAFSEIIIKEGDNIKRRSLDYYDSQMYPDGDAMKFSFAITYNSVLYFQCRTDGKIYIYDVVNNVLNETYLKANNDLYERIKDCEKNRIEKGECIDEKEMGLLEYIELIEEF